MYKKIIEGKKGALFDLDGTIVDTEIYWIFAIQKVLDGISPGLNLEPNVNKAYTKAGVPLDIRWATILNTSRKAIKMNIPDLVHQTNNNFLELLVKHPIQAREGFIQFLEKLVVEKKFKVGLVTNTRKEIATKIIESIELVDIFDICVYGDEVKNVKPHPEIYQRAIKLLNLPSTEIVVFEDSLPGIEAAISADLDVVGIGNNVTPTYEYPKKKLLEFFPGWEGLESHIDHTKKEALKLVVEKIAAKKNIEIDKNLLN